MGNYEIDTNWSTEKIIYSKTKLCIISTFNITVLGTLANPVTPHGLSHSRWSVQVFMNTAGYLRKLRWFRSF